MSLIMEFYFPSVNARETFAANRVYIIYCFYVLFTVMWNIAQGLHET